MKKTTFSTLICLSLLTSLLAAQTPPPISEEARKHFVMGTTLFTDAKSADDYALVINEFKRAVDLGPQWPEARYNLGLAREAAGDYSGAIADFRLYQKFSLPEREARTVQDKIYQLEAKVEKARRKLSDEGAALIERLQLSTYSTDTYFTDAPVDCVGWMIHFVYEPVQNPGENAYRINPGHLAYQKSYSYKGKRLYTMPYELEPTGGLTFGREGIVNGRFTLSEDGLTLTERRHILGGGDWVVVYRKRAGR